MSGSASVWRGLSTARNMRVSKLFGSGLRGRAQTMGKIRPFLSGLIIISCFLVSTAQQTGCLDENPQYDIVFLVDSSSSISTRDFQDVKTFMHTFVDGLDIDTKKVQVGLARFSTDPLEEFLIGDYANKVELFKKIDNLPYRTGGTYIGKALNFLKDNYFTSAGGSRIDEKVPQIVVVITDGDSADNIEGPAENLRKNGIIIFAIGVGPTNMTVLKAIANTPPERFVVNIENYQALQGLMDTVKDTVCILMRDQGKAIALKFADIFVMVDSLAQRKTQWIRGLLKELAVQLNVGDGSHKIALAQFGENVVKEFLFNDYKVTEKARDYINRFEPRPNGQRNIGEAIEYVYTNFLNTASGSRIAKGYKQYLLVLRTGNSDDSTLRAMRTMNNEDVTVFDIRLEANLDYLLPKTPTFQVQNQKFTDVAANITKQILKADVFNVTGDCTSAQVADIVFIVDESGSITSSNFQLVKRFIHRIISGLEVGSERVRVGMILYSDSPSAEFYLDSFVNKSDILNYVKIIPYRGGGTTTGAALKFAKNNLFTKRRGSRKDLGVKQIAVVITDGKSQDDVTSPAAELRRSGVTVYALGVKDASVEELKKIGSYPDRQFVFNVDNFQMLTSLEKSLRKSLCKVVVNRVFDKKDRFILKQGCVNTEEADIYFLLDHSGSTRDDFHDVKKFILGFLQLFTIGPNHVRVGVVNVDSDPTLQFSLTEHKNRVSLEAAVEKIIQPYGGAEAGKALTYVADLFSQAKASRPAKVQEILIVITNKKSQDLEKVREPAAELKFQGVSVYAIGLRNADRKELLIMTGDTTKQFYVSNYDALNPLKNQILTHICSQEACKNKVADIMFLIDGSTSIRKEDFKKMQTFITKVVNGTVIGKDNVHIGVVQFSDDPKLEFPLDRYDNQDEVAKAINSTKQLMGNTYIGEALSFISNYFDKSSGGRPDVPQFLVVITDGEAHDAVAAPAEAIRAKGVTIFSIGVGAVNTEQLQQISGTKERVYVERDFDALQSIEKNLQLKICSTEDCPGKPLADVIFLVQCTRRIPVQDFVNIRNFLISVVNNTQIGDNLIRTGVIVYSGTPNQFSLNQYNNKRQVVEAIETLKTPTGNDNTAKALGYSFNYFEEKNGGRHSQHIPQMLFLITDGDARDRENLRAQADQFLKKRINVYGIGVANARESELEIITKDKNKIFHVDNYEGLKGLQKNVSSVICNATKPECQIEVADLVFLIDGSESIEKEPWTTMIAFLLNVVDQFRISPKFYRIGIAQFSSSYKKELYLNEAEDVEGVKSAIRQIQQIKEGTKIGNALRNVVEFFEKDKGSRVESGIPQNLVLITDGKSSDSVYEAAENLRRRRINIFVIGIGDVSMQELSNIAGSPDRIFEVQTFDDLNEQIATVVDTICVPPSEQSSCTIDIGIGFDNSRTSSSSLSIFSNQKKLQSYLPEIIRYISVVHNLCCITSPTLNTNVGFRLVGDSGNMLNDFSFEEYDEGVVKKVMALQTSQSLKFNTRLLRSFEQKFRASNSPVKVLIIFTDGLDEPVEDLLISVKSLKTSGVKALMTVALEGFKNSADLQRLEFGRGMHYKQHLSIGMQNVASVMQTQIDTVASRECCNVMCKCTGHEGARGNYGRPGVKGPPGLRGLSGFPGEEGVPGDRGVPGLNGTRGHQGCIGRRGIKGGRGYRGDDGGDGEDGLDGVNGEQGLTGAAGSSGERGDPGSPGPRGIRGNPGNPGQRGIRGDPGNPGLDNNSRGPKGDIGGPGIQGQPGTDGIPGQIGDDGRPGPNGRRGSAGPLGPRGPSGTPGQQGLRGATGPLGALGPSGPVGQRGYIGLPGPQGSPGSPGRPGSKGSSGSRGQKGQPGDPGDKGAFGPPGPRGLPGKDGADGYGFPGPKGQKGDSGFPGYPGLQGEQGFKGGNGGGGPKGNRGRGGNAGRPGQPGNPGSDGMTGHRGSKGPRGSRQISDCQLISYVRDNCVCCRDNIKCPAYPTDLVIGLDMSEDVLPQGFERMRSVVLRLLDNINIAESSCPTGARVAVVSYSSYTKYLIRFSDYQRKKQLIEAVNNIALERTSNRRNIGAAMRFVGRNVLKRVRKGVLMRKVAIFLTAGESQDSTSLTTAILEYKALNIKLGVISLRNVPNMRRAFEADETQSFILTVLGRLQDQNTTLSKIQSCVICFDPCRPGRECDGTNLPSSPQELDMDLAVIVDGSRSILSDEYEGVKEVLGGVLDQIVVSSQPNGADRQARVAVYQQSSTYSTAQSAVKVIFGFQQFPDRSLMKRSIYQNLQQTGGSSRLDLAMEYAIMQGILTAPKGRKNKMVLAIIGEDMASQDRAKLDFISRVAKCEGVVLFTLMVGDHISTAQVEELASYPLEQHIIHLGHLKHGEHEYTQRFMRTFFHILSKNMNSYPHPSLQRQCSNFQRPGQSLDYAAAKRPVYSVPVASTAYPDVAVEEEDAGVETTESTYSIDLCHLKSDRGTICGEYVQRWYYNEAVGTCLPFWYGGCNGNSNRFNSEKECLQICGKQNPEEILQAKEETALVDDACFMKQDVGPCADYVLSWHYDIQQNECIHFWFGGCGGNKNRFNTQEECEALCVQDI